MGKEKLTRDQQRTIAREKARQLNVERVRKEKRRKVFLQVGIIVAIITVVAIVALVIFNAMKPGTAQANPKNMISNGVILGKNTKVVASEAIPVGGKAVYPELSPDKVSVVIYADYLCPYCKAFETSSQADVKNFLNTGKVSFEYRPVSFISEYSALAANATACVASIQPEKWWDVNNAFYEKQPDEVQAKNFTKATNLKTVKSIVSSVTDNSDVLSCVDNLPYYDWALAASNEALNSAIPNTNNEKVTGTPTIVVDGKKVNGIDAQALKDAVNAALAAKGLSAK